MKGRIFLFIVGAFLFMDARAQQFLSHKIDVYERPHVNADFIPVAVMCFNTGVASGFPSIRNIAEIVGHSSISVFSLDKSNTDSSFLLADEVKSVGLWPGAKRLGSRQEPVWLRENYVGDHFLMLEKGRYYKDQNIRHCVEISKSELETFNRIVTSRKSSAKWTPFYNCNDFAVEAFLGTLFEEKSLKERLRKPSVDEAPFVKSLREIAGVLGPRSVYKGLKNFQKNFKIKTQLVYSPKKESEISKMKALVQSGKVSLSDIYSVTTPNDSGIAAESSEH